MGDYIPNFIRCGKCKYYKPIDKKFGTCLKDNKFTYFVFRNMQVPWCFEKGSDNN